MSSAVKKSERMTKVGGCVVSVLLVRMVWSMLAWISTPGMGVPWDVGTK